MLLNMQLGKNIWKTYPFCEKLVFPNQLDKFVASRDATLRIMSFILYTLLSRHSFVKIE